MTDHLRGWPIERRDGTWVYADTGEPTTETWRDRPCGACGQATGPDGHDPCLGELPGVINACCGHGDDEAAYVQFGDGSDLRGSAARSWQTQHAWWGRNFGGCTT